ncbi:hypothetical protein SESBI_21370 [Sesbania bispinosa]|nr:hypothetical protein SESBI_21370 [Sesbania bispinosa]
MTEGQSSKKPVTGDGLGGRTDRRAARYNPLGGRPGGGRPNFTEIRRTSQWGSGDYTPLDAKRADILKEVYNANLLDLPLPARGPKGPYKNRWCEFHRVQGHDTEECWDLMNQIERLIKYGYLRRFVSTGGRRPSGGEGTRRDTVGRRERILEKAE